MLWDFIFFGIFTGAYLMLSFSKTLERHKKVKIKIAQQEIKQNDNRIMFNDNLQTEAKNKFDTKTYIKKIINYSIAFNSSFLIVGSMSESYYYSITMAGNIISITLGFIYACLVVHPFMHSLEKEITSPYQYFEKRFKSKIIRAVTAVIGMLFYFSFLSLYLWGCTILVCTLIPNIPFWLSSTLIGVYSIIGGTIGGYQQTTIINSTQFLTVIIGLITAIVLTVFKSKNSFAELWDFADLYKRSIFLELNTDIKIRYTLLNQILSLPMPWCAVHSLLLPNFIRYRTVQSKLKSRFLMISNFPVMVLVNLIVLLSGGFFCFIFFYGCDPFKSEKIINKNQIGTYWLYLILSEYIPSLTGILFSSILCYSIVQHSSGITLCSNTIIDEAIKPFLTCIKMSPYSDKRIKLIITIFFGVLSILYSISFQFAQNTMLSLFFLFNKTTNSPILGLFLLSAFNPYANAFGAITGFVTNIIYNYWYATGAILIAKEIPTDIALCNSNDYLTNFEKFDFNNQTYHSTEPISPMYASYLHDYILENFPEMHYLFSIPGIWYCIISVCSTFILGSFLSLAYSLVTKRSLDADSAFSEDRKKYLYFYKVFKKRKTHQHISASQV